MRYFSYIAEQSFKTGPDGERLFYRGGPWTRPYLIPDHPTERRLLLKQLWLTRIFLGGLIIGVPVLSVLTPDLGEGWFSMLIAIALIAKGWDLVSARVLQKDLAKLERVTIRSSGTAFYGEAATRHSTFAIVAGLVGSLAFVLSGVWMVVADVNTGVGVIGILFFGMCSIVWGNMLRLKLKARK